MSDMSAHDLQKSIEAEKRQGGTPKLKRQRDTEEESGDVSERMKRLTKQFLDDCTQQEERHFEERQRLRRAYKDNMEELLQVAASTAMLPNKRQACET